MNVSEYFDGYCQISMKSRKNRQNASKHLVFVEIGILWNASTKIISVFNQYATFYKRLVTSFFDEYF